MTEHEKIIDHLDTVIKFAGLAGSVSILVSIIYDWGFYHALGFTLAEVPMTLSDYARSSLEWFPYISMLVFVYIVWDLVMSRVEKGMTKEDIVRTSPCPKIMALIRFSPYIAIAGFSVLVLYNYVVFKKGSIWNYDVRLALIIFWFVLSRWIYSEKRIKDRTSKLVRQVFHWGPPVIFMIVSLGYDSASHINQLHNQVIWSTDSRTGKEAKIVRTFEKGLMIKENDKRNIVILPWSSIKKIEAEVRTDNNVILQENKKP